MKKRPFATEGHLHLPRELGPEGASRRSDSTGALQEAARASEEGGSGGVLLLPPGADGLAGARLLDDRHAGLDLRAGDEVFFVRGRPPEHGDLVLLPGDAAAPQIWKAYPEADKLRLLAAPHRRTLRSDPGVRDSVLGVIVAIKRPLPGSSP